MLREFRFSRAVNNERFGVKGRIQNSVPAGGVVALSGHDARTTQGPLRGLSSSVRSPCHGATYKKSTRETVAFTVVVAFRIVTWLTQKVENEKRNRNCIQWPSGDSPKVT